MSSQALNIPALLERCRHQAEALDNLALARDWCEQALPGADAEGRYHLVAFMTWLEKRLARRAARAGAQPRVGEVWLPLLDADGSGQVFMARLQAVDREARAGMPWTATFARALEQAEAAALDLVLRAGLAAGAPAQRPVLRLLGPPGLEEMLLDGASAGAAAALALISAWTGLPVPPGLAVTGAVCPSGELLAVEAAEAKVRCALREAPGRALVMVPSSCVDVQQPEVSPAATVAMLVQRTLGELPAGAALDIEGTVTLGEHLYLKAGRPLAASAALSVALDGIHQRRTQGEDPRHLRREELTCLWRLGAVQTHLGQERAALELLTPARALAEELWAEGEVDPADYFGVAGSLAVLLRDTLRLEQAEALLLATLDEQRALRQDRRHQARTLGNLGELWTIMGKHEQAAQVLTEALLALQDSYPDEVPRELCYLGNLELSRGDAEQALVCYEQGLEQNKTVTYGARLNETFLGHGRARALLALGRAVDAEAQAQRVLDLTPDEQPYPRQLSLMTRGLARLELGRIEQGREDLVRAADATQASGALLRFGLATSLARLSLHLMGAGELAWALTVAAEFVTQAAPYLDAYHDPKWSAGMSGLVSEREAAPEELAAALDQAVGLFLYA